MVVSSWRWAPSSRASRWCCCGCSATPWRGRSTTTGSSRCSGLLLLPYTTLSYVLLYWWLGEVTGFTWFFIVLAFFIDLGSYASSARTRNYRAA